MLALLFSCHRNDCRLFEARSHSGSLTRFTHSQFIMEVEGTRGQSCTDAWFKARQGRITASKVGDVIRYILKQENKVGRRLGRKRGNSEDLYEFGGKKFETKEEMKTCMGVLGCLPCFRLEALDWGLANERVAVEDLKEVYKDMTFSTGGLFIHKDYPWMGCSPDGIFSTPIGMKVLVEIKCPFRWKQRTDQSIPQLIREANACRKNKFYVIKNRNHEWELGKCLMGSKYFHQVQLSMEVMNINETMFVLWKPGDTITKRLFTFRVRRDTEWGANWIPRLKAFLVDVINPLKDEVSMGSCICRLGGKIGIKRWDITSFAVTSRLSSKSVTACS